MIDPSAVSTTNVKTRFVAVSGRRRALTAFTFLAATTGLARGEVLGVLDPHTGILTPTAASPRVTSVAAAAAAPVALLGAFKLICKVVLGPEIPTTAGLNGSAFVATSDAAFNNMVTMAGTFTRSGSSGTLTLYIPYYWTVASAGETVTVNFSASAASAAENFYAYSSTVAVTLPKNGATTAISFGAGL